MEKVSTLAIVYHYFEKDVHYRENLIFFLATAIDEDSDYFIIISGDCSIELPRISNVTYIQTINWNNDFGGYCTFVNEYLQQPYKAFIFVNSSVRGPFLPSYEKRDWTKLFLSPMTNGVHLVGASMNKPQPKNSQKNKDLTQNQHSFFEIPHIQTTAYAMSADAMSYLRKIGFYSVTTNLTKDDVVSIYEIGLSTAILQNGWEIVDLLASNGKVSTSTQINEYLNFSARKGDVLFSKAYYGRTLSPVEAVFVKVNRNMVSQCDLASYTFSSLKRSQEKLQNFPESQELLDKSYEIAKTLSQPNTIKYIASKINRWIRQKPAK